jgi:autophagy-related protein 9
MILQYGEQFYNNPKLLVNRQWSLKAYWKLRYYNELPHLFQNRLNSAGISIKEYTKLFHSKILETTAKFIIFIIGSFFVLFIFMSFLNQNLLINLDISHNRTILWYMGILGGILAISKSYAYNKIILNPEKILRKIEEDIDIDLELMNSSIYMNNNNNNNNDNNMNNMNNNLGDNIFCSGYRLKNHNIKKRLLKMFPQRILLLLEELYCLVITPYILWFVLEKEAYVICDYLINILVSHHSVNGLVNKNSLFISTIQIKENLKTNKSFNYFQKNYPEWGLSSLLYADEPSIYEYDKFEASNNAVLSIETNPDNSATEFLI